MKEIRNFCSVGQGKEKTEGLAFKTFRVFKETMAAIKIQRAWRNYQTNKLIGQYAFLYHQQFANTLMDTLNLPQ